MVTEPTDSSQTPEGWGNRHSSLDIADIEFNIERTRKKHLAAMRATLEAYLGCAAVSPRPLEGLRAIELGAGSGHASLMFARLGAHVTLLDYSAKSLEKAKEVFDHFGLSDSAEFVLADLTERQIAVDRKYDVSHSWGLVEHFRTVEDRNRVIRHHIDHLKDRAVSFIAVPNRGCLSLGVYLFLKRLSYTVRGREFPLVNAQVLMSRLDFERAFEGAGYGRDVSIESVIGSSVVEAYLPWVVYRNKRIRRQKRMDEIRSYRRSPLDDRMGYEIFLTILKRQL